MKVKYLVFAAITAMSITACSSDATKEGEKTEEAAQEEANPMVQKWTLDGYDMSAMMAEVPKEQQPQMEAMMDEMVKSQKGKFTMDFKEDGKVVMNTPDMMEQGKWKTTEGTWKLSDDNKKLTTVTEGKTETLNVTELTADKLTLEIPEQKMSMSFVPMK